MRLSLPGSMPIPTSTAAQLPKRPAIHGGSRMNCTATSMSLASGRLRGSGRGQPLGRGPQLDEMSHSRHCILFEHLRYYAYSIVNRERERGSFSTFTRLLEAYAHNSNSFHKLGFMENLAQSSIKATVKSVARWTWDRYTGCGRCHRGVMQLDKELPLVERQRLAAARTNDVRHKATESRVRAACRLPAAEGRSTHASRYRPYGRPLKTNSGHLQACA